MQYFIKISACLKISFELFGFWALDDVFAVFDELPESKKKISSAIASAFGTKIAY